VVFNGLAFHEVLGIPPLELDGAVVSIAAPGEVPLLRILPRRADQEHNIGLGAALLGIEKECQLFVTPQRFLSPPPPGASHTAPCQTYQTKPCLKGPLRPRVELLLAPREAIDQDAPEPILLGCVLDGKAQDRVQLRRREEPLVVELVLDASRQGRPAVCLHPGAQAVPHGEVQQVVLVGQERTDRALA
jgi:hypothetical protein